MLFQEEPRRWTVPNRYHLVGVRSPVTTGSPYDNQGPAASVFRFTATLYHAAMLFRGLPKFTFQCLGSKNHLSWYFQDCNTGGTALVTTAQVVGMGAWSDTKVTPGGQRISLTRTA